MKYIIFQDNSAVIFSESISHKSIAGDMPVSSAGFCQIETYRNQFDDIRAKASCWGKSDSLGIAAFPSDNKIIERIFI